jgi:hypothetical protein
MLIAQLVVKLAAVTVSVRVNVSVAPSYVMCACMMLPECRLTPELVKSVAGVVGDTPLVYKPVELGPSPALL